MAVRRTSARRQSGRRPLRPGPGIIRAWFDTVLKYLLYGLQVELRQCERGDWTWRFRPPGLESFGLVREHVVAEAWPNLDQFVEFHRQVSPLIEVHDRSVEKLKASCQAYHNALIGSEALKSVYRMITAEPPATLGAEISRFFGAYSTEEDFLGVLAEEIVNNKHRLPSYYADAPLWNRYRDQILAVREDPAVQPHFRATVAAGEEVKAAAAQLIEALRQTQSELSWRFDVPLVSELTASR